MFNNKKRIQELEKELRDIRREHNDLKRDICSFLCSEVLIKVIKPKYKNGDHVRFMTSSNTSPIHEAWIISSKGFVNNGYPEIGYIINMKDCDDTVLQRTYLPEGRIIEKITTKK